MVRTPALIEEGIADRMLRSEVEGVMWGDRRAYFTYTHGELVLKAEVASAAEAERMIRSGILVGGKKCEVRAWTKEMKGKGETAAPQKATGGQVGNRAPMGRWKAGAPNTNAPHPAQGVPRQQIPTPTELAAMRRGGHTQGGGTTTGVGIRGNTGGGPRGRMLSNVRCYRCGLMGHLQYTCTSPSRRAAAGVGNGHGILPVPVHVSANQNGKRPASELSQDAKKPAVGDGSKYGKPYWLAELERVKDK